MKQALPFLIPLALALAFSCSKPQPPAQKPAPVLETQSAAGNPSPAPTQDLSDALSGLTQAAPGNPSMGTPVNGPVSQEPMEYVIEDLKGSVSVREEGSTQAEPAEEEEVVGEGDEIITGEGSEASLTLDENTLVHVAQNSDVKVDQLRPKPESGFLSRLELAKGRVLSEVEKLGESHSTFEVESGGVVCGVRGTAFEVQKEGGTIHTFTYHGVVEMRQGTKVQAVVANHHSAYSPEKGGFLPPRALSGSEMGRYQNWLPKRTRIRQKQQRRLAVLRKLSNLPPAERNRMLENLRGVPAKDRMRRMHQMLQKPFHPGRGGMEKPRPGFSPRNPAKPKNGKGPGPAPPKGQHHAFQKWERPQGPGRGQPGTGRPHPPSHFQKRPVKQSGRLSPAPSHGPQKGRPLRPAQGKPGRPQKNNGKKQGEKRKEGER